MLTPFLLDNYYSLCTIIIFACVYVCIIIIQAMFRREGGREGEREGGSSRPIPMNKCILAVNFAQQSPEDTKRLFSEPTTLSQKSCYIMCKRCLGLNNYLVDINFTKISR